MQNCSEIQDHLSEYLDKELKQKDFECFEEHLSSCAECRSDVQFFREAEGMAVDIEVPDPGKDYWDSFSARVKARAAGKDTSTRALLIRLGRMGGALAVAASLVIIVIFAVTGSGVIEDSSVSLVAVVEEGFVDMSHAEEVALTRIRRSVLPVLASSEVMLTSVVNLDSTDLAEFKALRAGLRRAALLEIVAIARDANRSYVDIDRVLNSIEAVLNRIENIAPGEAAEEIPAIQNAVLTGGMLDDAKLLRERLLSPARVYNSGLPARRFERRPSR